MAPLLCLPIWTGHKRSESFSSSGGIQSVVALIKRLTFPDIWDKTSPSTEEKQEWNADDNVETISEVKPEAKKKLDLEDLTDIVDKRFVDTWYQKCLPEGDSLVHLAMYVKNYAVLKRAAEYGEDFEALNDECETPLHRAARSGNYVGLKLVCNLLRRQGKTAFLMARNRLGMTPFMLAAKFGHIRFMELLYLEGVDLDQQDDLGRTALFWAVAENNRKSVGWLFARRCNAFLRDIYDLNPLTWAVQMYRSLMVEMYFQHEGEDVFRRNGNIILPNLMYKRMNKTWMILVLAHITNLFFKRPLLPVNYKYVQLLLAIPTFMIFFTFWILPGLLTLGPVIGAMGLLLLSLCSVCTFLLFYIKFSPATRENVVSHKADDSPVQLLQSRQKVIKKWEDALTDINLHEAFLRSLKEYWTDRAHLLDIENRLYRQEMTHLEKDDIRDDVDVIKSDGLFELPALTAKFWARHGLPSSLESLESLLLEIKIEAAGVSKNLAIERCNLCDDYDENYLPNVEDLKFEELCVTCQCVCDIRSYHCKRSGACLKRFDHFCPVLGHGIGLNNIHLFTVSIFLALLPSLLVAVLLPLHYYSFPVVNYRFFIMSLFWISNIGGLCFLAQLTLRHVLIISCDLTSLEFLEKPKRTVRRFGENWTLPKALRIIGGRRVIRNWTSFFLKRRTINDNADEALEEVIYTPLPEYQGP